ncbi:hypothetical protein LTR64_003308 [Lithohypha guttulata]|uniref:uncharacterized protein n=1 Tax=Lithohypha guttulata TaxID=1690604 RepID=UPI002DDE07EB|nr:hypothetical protein LTR51_000472 [Lithohypha guttulata]
MSTQMSNLGGTANHSPNVSQPNSLNLGGPQTSTQTTPSNTVSNVRPTVTNAVVGQHAQSVFRFRKEKAQWLSVLGILIAMLAFSVGVPYALDTFALARWTAEKDYQLYCQGLKSRPAARLFAGG